jgi:hypothetical protein
MILSMSMFASSADYWKARAELAETTVRETAEALGCEPDNEEMLAAAQNAERYRKLRDGQNWPAAFARHDAPEPLRGVDLDAAIDGTEPHIDGWPLFSGLPQS